MRKGQVEFVAILGILVVAVVAVIFTWQGMAPPSELPALSAEQQVVADSVNSFVKSGAEEVLATMAQNGGYLSTADFPMGSTDLNDKPVPYWLYNGQVSVPNFRTTFLQGITDYIQNNREYLEESLADQDVTLGEPAVSVDVQPSRITVTVNMPTTMKGTSVPQPYQTVIPTQMPEAFEFAESFARFEAQNRFFEYATLSSMMISPLEDGKETIPIALILTGCGSYAYYDWWDIQPYMEDAVRTTAAHTYMPGKVPLNVGDKTSYPKYSLPQMNGKAYSDLDVSFFTPDEWELNQNTLQMSPNPVVSYSRPIPMSTLCFSEPLEVNYYVVYPLIGVVEDPFTGNLLRFASSVYINNNEPGSWDVTGGYADQREMCENPRCTLDITVLDGQGNSVPGASVSFMDCPTGQTDGNGDLTATVPCGSGPLKINRGQNYVRYQELKSTSTAEGNELDGLTVTLQRMPVVNLKFHKVTIINETAVTGYYRINSAEVTEDEVVQLTFVSSGTGETYSKNFEASQGTLEFVPPKNYNLFASIWDSGFTSNLGGAADSFVLSESHDGETLNVYVPVISGFSAASGDEKRDKAAVVTILMNECGMDIVSETEFDTEQLPCSKREGEF